MSYNANRYSGHGDRGTPKGKGKRKDRGTNLRENKVESLGDSTPKNKWEVDRKERAKALSLVPKTENQQLFLDSLKNNVITIGTGSAGTRKNFCSM